MAGCHCYWFIGPVTITLRVTIHITWLPNHVIVIAGHWLHYGIAVTYVGQYHYNSITSSLAIAG